jgi:AcrR family transcriptional regulator
MTARAASAAKTRDRVVRAACAVYARDGFRGATMQAVAHEADVSPATVLNHFDTPDRLLAAALEHLTGELGLPDPAEVRSHRSLGKRVGIVSRALATCFERGQEWYLVFAHDRDHPVMKASNDEFYRRVDALVRAALGQGLRDRETVTIVSTLLGWQNFESLRGSGMSADAAGDVIAEVVLGWLRSRGRTVR